MISELLHIQPGVTAVIGSGGKTTLLRVLGEELAARGYSVLLTTTTHILPFDGIENLLNPTEAEVADALQASRLICAGTPEEKTGKLTAPKLPMAALARLAQFVLVEADGAHHLPLKAHGPHEPVIPPEAGQTVCVVGLSGLGLPICQVVHRPEIFCALTGAAAPDDVTLDLAARALNAESLANRYFLNQADDPEKWAWAKALAQELNAPAVAGSLQKGAAFLC